MTGSPAAACARFLYGANVKANGIRQHYLRFGGTGRPLVLIPGIISTAAMWAFVAERLSQHFDVYVLDVRGRGLSECGEHLDYGIDACAADVIAFVDALKLPSCVLVGHSMGARIAIRVARQNPASLEQTILIDPPVSGPNRRAYPLPLSGMLELVRAAKRGDVIDRLRQAGSPAWPERQLFIRAEWLHTCDECAIETSYIGFHQDDIHSDLHAIRRPATLILASRGGVVLPVDAEEIGGLLPSIGIRYVPDAGHQIQLDNFDGLFEVLGVALNCAFV